jgi:hypothetical protein
MPHVLVWDIESVPDLRRFAAANGLGGNDAILKLKCSVSRSLKPPDRSSLKRSSNKFTGRVAMVMGAKNMTMTEVQHARRIGECSPAKLGSAARF